MRCDTIRNPAQTRKRRADNYYDADYEDGGVDNDDDDNVDNNNHCGGSALALLRDTVVRHSLCCARSLALSVCVCVCLCHAIGHQRLCRTSNSLC